MRPNTLQSHILPPSSSPFPPCLLPLPFSRFSRHETKRNSDGITRNRKGRICGENPLCLCWDWWCVQNCCAFRYGLMGRERTHKHVTIFRRFVTLFQVTKRCSIKNCALTTCSMCIPGYGQEGRSKYWKTFQFCVNLVYVDVCVHWFFSFVCLV